MITYSRRGLHGQVVDQLGRRIVHGELAPGDTIDVLQLESELNVSRTVVREAVKVLTAKGLLDARPRLGTFVRERAYWNLLDSDVLAWRSDGDPAGAAQLMEDLAEVRQIVEPWGARLAAQRRTPQDLERIRKAFEGLSDAGERGTAEHIGADVIFHRAVLAATHNELLEQLAVVLEPALRIRNALAFGSVHDTSYVDRHEAVLHAVVDQDVDGAADAMTALLVDAGMDARRAVVRRKSR